ARLSEEDGAQLRMLQTPRYKCSVEALVSVIRDNGLEKATIGIDEVGITPTCFDELTAALPNVTFRRANSFLQKVRSIKTAEEIDRLRGAARVGEMSIKAALAIAAEGVTELDFLSE